MAFDLTLTVYKTIAAAARTLPHGVMSGLSRIATTAIPTNIKSIFSHQRKYTPINGFLFSRYVFVGAGCRNLFFLLFIQIVIVYPNVSVRRARIASGETVTHRKHRAFA